MARLHRNMGDLFHGFFGDWDSAYQGGTQWPLVDVDEQDDTYIVRAEVPGCRAEDIDISVHDNSLVISGWKNEEKKEGKGYYHLERSFGSFRRELVLGGDVDPNKIEASCENGVLTVKLPKSEKAKPVKIKVKG